MRQQILVIDPDHAVANRLVADLESVGFAASSVADATGALELVQHGAPDLVVMDTALPGGDGLALLRNLAAGRTTTATPVIVLTAISSVEDRVRALRAGADDFLHKPHQLEELIERIRTVLRRADQLRNLSPLTGLPGNAAIADELCKQIDSGETVAVAHVDITNFKTYNDAYGFLRGDRVITRCADCLRSAAAGAGSAGVFIGHIGGDDFVAIMPADDVDAFCRTLIDLWDGSIAGYYDPEDVSAGISVVDRHGELHRYPLASLAIGVATNRHRSFASEWEASAIAAEMKEYAKRQPGSNYQIDRRSA